MTIPTEYRSDHLFLLVGTNPLPNVVAICLLRPANGHVYLLCTKDTKPIAKKIIKAVDLPRQQVEVICVNDDRGGEIVERVSDHAANKSSVGLNYTGGTKHMVLHAYQGIQRETKATKVYPVLSYLDARTLRMRIEHHGQPTCSFAVGVAVEMDFDSLLHLHGYKVSSRSTKPILPKIYSDLAKLKPTELSGWYQKARKNKKLVEQREIPLPDIPSLNCYWQGAKTVGELSDLLEVPMQEMGGWFAGHWLEHYALAAIQENESRCRIHDSAMNVVIGDFEFDVVAMKGYQLFAMSCVTQGDKKTVKQKLFEAYVRARQMGGDEARVAVICFAEKDGKSSPARIEKEVIRDWDVDGKVRVFGEEHLPDLPEYLAYWIGEEN